MSAVNYESVAICRSEDDGFRSDFVRDLLCSRSTSRLSDRDACTSIPRSIVQFWDNPSEVPDDVRLCMDSWQALRSEGFALACFDESLARHFVADKLEPRHVEAFDVCYHPAMRSDYFRLCYIGSCGGCYVDADDVYRGNSVAGLFSDGRLKLHPLCYDAVSGTMVSTEAFTRPDADSRNWIFYFNNNPLIAPPGHPIVLRALERSTNLLNAIEGFGSCPDMCCPEQERRSSWELFPFAALSIFG